MATNNPENLLDDDTLTAHVVRLQLECDAEGPGDAVSRYIAEVARRGFDDFIYRVRNKATKETWIVRQGQVYTSADYVRLVGGDEAEPD